MSRSQDSNQLLPDELGSDSTQVTPTGRANFRGLCMYPSTNCTAERAVKKNGAPHTLCPFHRAKHNQQQRKFDAKKRRPDARFAPYDMQAMQAAATASEAMSPPPPPLPRHNTHSAIKTELQLVFRNRLHDKQQKRLQPTTPPPPADSALFTLDVQDNQGADHDAADDCGHAAPRPTPPPLPPLASLLRRFDKSTPGSNK